MAVLMTVDGILVGVVHFVHHRQRRNIRLFAPPDSIAVAASVTRDSPVQELVRSGWGETTFRRALKDEKFGMDSVGSIVRIEGRAGKANSNSPRSCWRYTLAYQCLIPIERHQ
jgi:hypothetical protein